MVDVSPDNSLQNITIAEKRGYVAVSAPVLVLL